MSRLASILLVSLALILFTAMATYSCPAPTDNPNNQYTVDENTRIFTQDQSKFTVKKGEEFAIRLDSNPTTGYTWMLKDDSVPNGLTFLGCRYKRTPVPDEPDGRPLVGSGGADTWGFSSTATGTTTIQLQYVRPWMKPRPDKVDATFTVTVQ